jgi:hypothetical protein
MKMENNMCRVRVRLLVVATNRHVVGVADGPAAMEDQLRTSAEATILALRQIGETAEAVVELRDVTTFDAFGKSGVMVSLQVEQQGLVYFLTGFSHLRHRDDEQLPADVEIDLIRGRRIRVASIAQEVALAVLNATNRVLALG